MQATPPSVMLSKYGLAPSKRRGQNFLSDDNVARKIVAAVGAGADDVVLEIGPGFGAITSLRKLKKRLSGVPPTVRSLRAAVWVRFSRVWPMMTTGQTKRPMASSTSPTGKRWS